MEYVNFGNAGVKISRLAFGLGLRGHTDEAEAQRVIEHAFDLGINFIDCANLYGPNDDRDKTGRSEVVLGKALKGRRNDVVITTKVAAAIGSDTKKISLAFACSADSFTERCSTSGTP